MKSLVVQAQIVRFLLLECPSVQQIELPSLATLDGDWLPMLNLFAERCERWKTDLVDVPNCCEIIVRDFLEEIEYWMPGDVLIPHFSAFKREPTLDSFSHNKDQKGVPANGPSKNDLELGKKVKDHFGKDALNLLSPTELFKRCKPLLKDWGFENCDSNSFRHRIGRLKKVPKNFN